MNDKRQPNRKPNATCFVLACLATVFCSHAVASFKHFEAPMDESQWAFNGNPLACNLSHSIPYYGDAKFSKIAGKNKALGFKLGYKRQALPENTKAQVRAISPSWQPKSPSRLLGEVTLSTGRSIVESKEKASWKLLNELEVGRFPTFYYQDFDQVRDQVAVSLSSVGFRQEYDKFLDCMSSLVEYELADIRSMTLYFQFDKASINQQYKAKLSALAQYIKYDPDIEIVFVNGYTDSKGPRFYNQKLSEKRVESVRKILQQPGVDDDRFKLSAYGEKKPAATNRTAKGRALNRRVVIRIAQN